MARWIANVAGLAVAYLFGSIPTAYLAGKLLYGLDIREHGSKSVGATNALRVLGKWPALVALLVDILKGAAAITFVRWLCSWRFALLFIAPPLDRQTRTPWAVGLAGLAALLGHSRPISLPKIGRLRANCRLLQVGINMLMENNGHRSQADPSVVQAWVRGWTLARDTRPPVAHADGWRVDIGWPQQRVRYVFSRCSKALQSLAETIIDPWIFLKVCAAPEVVQMLLPSRWIIQPLGFMMICTAQGREQDVSLSGAYILNLTEAPTVTVAKVLTENGEIASIGRVVFVDDFAIYDRIETHNDHRRRGLASAVMNMLQTAALARAKTRGVLVATSDGRALYETLGWRLHSLYTTAVIPGPKLPT
jgi:GNAT superfamily N-acetyltransferase